jgi:hypothetical protein
MQIRFFVAPLLLAVTLVAVADDKVLEKPVGADTPEKFAAAAKQVRDGMNQGGRYEFIRPEDKGKVETDLNAIEGMLQKSGSTAAMSEKEKLALFNTQEHLNGLLTHNDRNRLICESRAPLGSHLPVTTCHTYAEVMAQRSNTQKTLTDMERQQASGASAKKAPGGN